MMFPSTRGCTVGHSGRAPCFDSISRRFFYRRMIEEREEKLNELETALERIQDEKDNSKRLLETVEGDKSALSRALTQNRTLKAQLEELENRWVDSREGWEETRARWEEIRARWEEIRARWGDIQRVWENSASAGENSASAGGEIRHR